MYDAVKGEQYYNSLPHMVGTKAAASVAGETAKQ
jgi:hypothetical protein